MENLRRKTTFDNFAVCRRKKGEEPVYNGLAYSPADMYDMALAGHPIATQMEDPSNFNEGIPHPNFEVPFENERGVDINHLWQREMSVRNKIRNAKQLIQSQAEPTPGQIQE